MHRAARLERLLHAVGSLTRERAAANACGDVAGILVVVALRLRQRRMIQPARERIAAHGCGDAVVRAHEVGVVLARRVALGGTVALVTAVLRLPLIRATRFDELA